MDQSALDAWHMQRALELASRARGHVEPNPLVGCVITHGAESIGEGWHRRFGGAHAEVEALNVAQSRARDSTLYVTLEPCCHFGKTPPCTKAILDAGVRRVVVAHMDPFSAVAGNGLAELRAAGLEVTVGVAEAEARRLNAPYLKRLAVGRPWVIGKWAMTLDGKIATRTGDSRWISGPESRALVHELRGRVDAIIVGRGTCQIDDPLLTARPPGPRVATRIVVDSRGLLPTESQLVRTARQVPLLVAVSVQCADLDRRRLEAAGCEVFVGRAADHTERWLELMNQLGRRGMTNVLVEGGARLFGNLHDARQLDEVHVFLAPKLLGGLSAPSPIAGEGRDRIAQALLLDRPQYRPLGDDIYISGYVARQA